MYTIILYMKSFEEYRKTSKQKVTNNFASFHEQIFRENL